MLSRPVRVGGRAPLLIAAPLHADAVRPSQRGRDDGLVAEPGPDVVDRSAGVVPTRLQRVVQGQLRAPSSTRLLTETPSSRTPVDGSTWSSRSFAARATAGPLSTAAGQRDRPGDRAEVVEPDLDVHGPPREVMPAEPGRHRVRHSDRLPLQGLERRGGRGRTSPRGRSTSAAGREQPAGRRPACASRCRWRPLALPRNVAASSGRERGEVADGRDPSAAQLLERLRTDSPQRLHRERMQERQLLARRDHLHAEARHRPVTRRLRLRRFGRELGEELVRRDAHRARQTLLRSHTRLESRRRSRRRRRADGARR